MRSTAYKPTYEIDGTVPGNNSEQYLLLLMLTACRGHWGIHKSPFWASQVVRGMPECSRIYAFDSQQRSYFACASLKAKMGPIQKAM